MATQACSIEFDMPDLAGKYRRRMRELYIFVAAQIQTNRGMLFDKEGGYNGHAKWAPLKFRQGQILSKRGNLRKSIAPLPARGRPGNDGIVRISGETVTVGTKLYYARLMNDGTTKMPGGVLKAKGKALRIPLPSGKSATTLAKKLRKSAATGKSLFDKISALEQDIASTRIPARKAKLREQLVKLKKSAAGTKPSDKYLFVKSVKIPSRPFDIWTNEDQKELDEALSNKIAEILNQ